MPVVSGQRVDVCGPVDHKLTAEIENMVTTLGEPVYTEILRRAGHSHSARTIPNSDRQKVVIEWMQAAARGFERLHALAEMAGETRFIAAMERLKIASNKCLPNLAALRQLIEELESINAQQVA